VIAIVDPPPGAACRGVVRIEAAAPGALRVEFLVDGALRGKATRLPFVFDWYTTRFADGGHQLTARAVTANANEEATVALTVANGVSDQNAVQPFPPTSLWRRPIPLNAKLDPQSNAKMAYWQQTVVPHYPNVAIRRYGVATAVANTGCPRYTVQEKVYPGTIGAFGQVPVPAGTKADASADGHLAVWEPSTHREWDFWQASFAGGKWSCGAGAAVATDGDGCLPAGTQSGCAANFPLLGGLLRPEDIAGGRIRHALVFAQPEVNRPLGALAPATHNDGSSQDSRAHREGTLLQLDPALALDTLGLPPWQKIIAKALQTYGMYLRDESGTLTIYAENPVNRVTDGWAALGLTGNSVFFDSAFPWNRMRIVAWRP
jgi:hypothetical protein